MSADFDVAVAGSGFAGSLIAAIAKRLGRSVVLLERGKHPRFAIGESSTPLANLLLDELAQRYDLPRLLPLTKWGKWQQAYPKISCGLKRGFTFYHHQTGRAFQRDPLRQNQLLVAASPADHVADTHWYRPDFDQFLVEEAQAGGAEYVDQIALDTLEFRGGQVQLEGERQGKRLSMRTRFLIDATGPRGFLHRALQLPEAPFEHLSATEALFSHFTDVHRLSEMEAFREAERPPYPVDDAAVHHVFEGGWIWVLRFNNGITSAGVAATKEFARTLRFMEGKAAWQRLLEGLPSIREQFEGSVAQCPFVHMPQLGFRSRTIVGPQWGLLPSAAGFVDPLLSTGFPLTLAGVTRLVRALEEDWETPRFEGRLRDYASETIEELRAAELLVAALYAAMKDFPTFSALTLLYFAAVSFSETVRRLGKTELAPSFLLRNRTTFHGQLQHLCLEALSILREREMTARERAAFWEAIYRAIEPIDVAGLGKASRRNWHPVDAQDLLGAANKCEATVEEMKALLVRCGFGN